MSVELRDRLGAELGFQEADTGVWWGPCPACDARKASIATTGFTCSACDRVTSLVDLARWVEDEKSRAAPPTLAEAWTGDLESYLDPDPFLIRPSAAGMGRELDRMLGGGLTVGQTVALGSRAAGGGKTAWLHQLADGIAEASAASTEARRVATPVVFISEMTVRDLTIRALARRAGVEGYLLRDPRGPKGSEPLAGELTRGQNALELALRAAYHWRTAAEHMTVLDRRARVQIRDLAELVRRVRTGWEERGVEVPIVVLIVDPIHRLLDPSRSEVEGLSLALTACMDVAQDQRAVVLFTSDTTFAAASARSTVGGLKRSEEVANATEMSFRGSYQLVHLPDVALGLLTMRADDEHLEAEDASRLAREPEGTQYAEISSGKARWEDRGLRAAYLWDPAMFRFRPTTSRALPRELTLEERIIDFVGANPECSENAVRKGVEGKDTSIRKAIARLVSVTDGRLVDENLGTDRRGRCLRTNGTTRGTRREQGGNNPQEQDGGQGGCSRGLPLTGESPPGEQPATRASGAASDGQRDLVDELLDVEAQS